MRVFVTGATGVLGQAAVPLLVGEGFEVTAAVRADSTRRIPAGATACHVDLFDPDATHRLRRVH